MVNASFILVFFMVILPASVFSQAGNHVVDYETIIKFEKGKLITEKSFLIQINDKLHDWFADVQIPYEANQGIQILEAYIVGPKGNIVRTLKDKEVVTKSRFSSASFFEDKLLKEFSLKWNEYPYRIKYRYKESAREFLHIENWYPYYRNVPIRKASLNVDLPVDFKIKMNYTDSLLYKTEVKENIISHSWEIFNIPEIEEEIFSPHLYNLLPNVNMVPVEFTYGVKGNMESWQSFGNWIESLNESLDNLPQYEKERVDKIIDSLSSKKDIVMALYHYLQDHTRYINVSIDIGGMKPYPASYVCQNKYGDCKALTIYMKALLKHAGIPSYYTIVYGSDNPPRINDAIPSQQFNHVILCVPLGNDTIWLENTATYTPMNYVGTFIQNRSALLVNKDSSKLVTTPALTPEDVSETGVYNFTIDEEGEGTLRITKTYRGERFEYFRYIQQNMNVRDQKETIEEALGVPGAILTHWSFDYPNRTKAFMNLLLEMEVKNQLRKMGGMIILNPFFKSYFIPKKEESRKYPVVINYPVNKTDTIIYNSLIFDKYKVSLPENISIDSKYGMYAENHRIEDGKLFSVQEFVLYPGNYPKDEFSNFLDFFESIKTIRQKSPVILTP